MIAAVLLLPLAALAAAAAAAQAQPADGASPDKTKERKPPSENGAIVVTGRRPPVERRIDGTSYDVRDSAQGQAGSAADLLNTIPSVSVSPDGGVTVRGSSNVQVYVDGRPSAAMSGENRGAALQSMSAGSIARVEVITNPSARYDANGGAILNLVLNKAEKEGLRGTATANAGNRGRRNAALNASYGGKLSASLNASLRQDVRFTCAAGERRLFAPDGTAAGHSLTVFRYTPTRVVGVNLGGSIGYAPTARSRFGLDLSVFDGRPRNRVYEEHLDQLGGSDAPLVAYRRVRGGTYVRGNSDLTLHYDRDGGPDGWMLKLAVQHGEDRLRSNRLFTTYPDSPPLPPTGERVLNRNLARVDRAAIDHERPIGGGLRLVVGAEWKRELVRVENGRTAFDPIAEALPPPQPPGRIEAVQRSAAAYATLDYRSGPWTAQAGERFEDLRIRTSFALGPSGKGRRLDGFNHSLSVARELGEERLVLRLSRSRQRFDPQDLNPAMVYVDAQNRHAGNPALDPQVVTSAEAEYDGKHGGGDWSATFYYRRTDQAIVDFREIGADNVLTTTKRNLGRSLSFGGELSLSGKIGKKLKYSLTGNVFRSELADPGPGGERKQALLSYTGQASLDWSAAAKDQVHVDANLQGPSLIPQGRRSGTGAVNLVWRRKLGARWTASLTAQGLVRDISVHSVIRAHGGVDIADFRSGARAIFLGAAYRIR